ncbi:MAG: hypothetical protein V4525_08425 [Pseudomonadota bacterium]
MKKAVTLLMATISGGCLAQYMDASNFQQAITMAAVDFSAAEGIRQRCTKLLPEKALNIHSLSLDWLDRNRREHLAVTAYSHGASALWISAVDKTALLENIAQSKLPQYVQVQYCKWYFGSIKNGDQDIVVKTPKVSKFLDEYLSKNPLSEEQQEMSDVVFGCIKQANNRAIKSRGRFDLDETRPICECVGQVHQTKTTREERTLEGKFITEQRPLTELPHMQRLGPLYARCYSTSR